MLRRCRKGFYEDFGAESPLLARATRIRIRPNRDRRRRMRVRFIRGAWFRVLEAFRDQMKFVGFDFPWDFGISSRVRPNQISLPHRQ
jgi:hypothetical protein